MTQAEKQFFYRLNNVLKGQGMFIREDEMITDQDKLKQMNILLQVSHFLKDLEQTYIEKDKEDRGDENDSRD